MKYTIIKFEKADCPPCRMVDKWLSDNGIEVQHVSAFDDPEFAAGCKVRSCPTVIVFDLNPKRESTTEVFRTVGYKPDELDTLKQYANE